MTFSAPVIHSVQLRGDAPQSSRADEKASYRLDIDGLRAVAVVLVVLFHAGVPAISGGFVGVDVFFVISGFLITGLLLDEVRRSGTVSLRRFYARRARRLLPLATLVIAATAVAAIVVLPPLDHPSVREDLLAAAVFAANWHFAAESTQYMADSAQSPVLHFWSLAVEEQFYLVWPLLLLVLLGGGVARRSWAAAVRRTAIALVLLVGASFAVSALTTAAAGPWAYFGVHTRAWELGAGAGLALLRPVLPRLAPAVGAVLGFAGIAVVVGSAVVLDRSTVFPGTAAVWPVLGACLLLIAGARPDVRGVPQLLSRPGVRYVGRLSYGWYLWHWPCLVIAAALVGPAAEASGHDESTAARPLVAGAAVAVSFVLAAVSHRLVEQPVRHARVLAPAARGLALGAGLVVVSLVAGALVGQLGVSGAAGSASAVRPADLAQARKDLPSVTEGCQVGYSGPPALGCLYGDPDGDRTMVLLGDSHAFQWFPAADEWAQENGWRLHLWTKDACPFVDVAVWRLAGVPRLYSGCEDRREEVFERLAELPRVDAVVLSSSYKYEEQIAGADGEITDDEDEVRRLWAAGFHRTVEALQRYTPAVVVLRDTPWASTDVPACLSEHLADPQACAFPLEGNVHRDEMLREAEARGVRGEPGVEWIDLTDAVCPADPCRVVTRDGTIVYRDQQHLTASFARTLADEFGAAVQRALAQIEGDATSGV